MRHACMILLTFLLPLTAMGQTETPDGQRLSGTAVDGPQAEVVRQLASDSIPLQHDLMTPRLTIPRNPTVESYTQLTKQGATGLGLWRGAYVGFYGTTSQLPGLMNIETGGMMLHQDLGRWHFTATGLANKYWMPWQRTLSTQYGLGGTVAYDLSETVTLHAFGYYYANRIQVGPAMSPYVNNTTYGGYADVRFSSILGANVGVRRYVNPMNGKWTTEPIVNPYIKLGKDSKIELPLGSILKALVWGDRDNPMNYRPHPMSRPPGNR